MPFGDWSWPDPLEIPDSSPDESAFHYCRFNESYLSFVLGAVEQLLNPVTWSGDGAAVALSLEKIHTLLDEIATYRTESTVYQYARIGEIQAQGTGGGTPVLNAWTRRVLNYKFIDNDNIVTINDNRFYMPVGTYRIFAATPWWNDNASGKYFSIRLINSIGTKEAAHPPPTYVYASNVGLVAYLSGVLVQAEGDYWELQYLTNAARATTGLGVPLNVTGATEIYTSILIERVA